jgi:hypothetical protein
MLSTGAVSLKAIVIATTATTFQVGCYALAGLVGSGSTYSVFVYGSEFKKGTNGMEGSLEAEDVFFENKPIILKDKYCSIRF